MLRTNIELDEKLVDEAMRLTHKRSKKELVNYALEELVRRLNWIAARSERPSCCHTAQTTKYTAH